MPDATTTLTLAAFLEARLADDEAAALAATPDGWHHSDAHGSSVVTADRQSMVADFSPEGDVWRGLWSYAAHMARHDPARVLAEVAAKRAIIAGRAELDADARTLALSDPDEANAVRMSRFGLDIAIKHLAAVYSDHPDYDESWRP